MNKPIKIGNIELKNPFLLAPMAGYTDKTMRTLCTRQGASLTYTEMISGKGLMYGSNKTEKLLEKGAEEKLLGFQVFGSEPDVLEYAAKTLCSGEMGNVILDLNCGCPVPKIVRNGEGSALLKNLDILYDAVCALVKGAKIAAEASSRAGTETSALLGSVPSTPSPADLYGSQGMGSPASAEPMPITVKIRKGFYKGENIAAEAAEAAQAAGAAAVTVHGRTREQYYEGRADWPAIADVKRAVDIPVIGNGDVMSGEDAIRMMDQTGCDAVMIARGALGNPWIFSDAADLWEAGWKPESGLDISRPGAKISNAERINMLITHFNMLIEDKGERTAVREIRKFIGYYTKGIYGAAQVRRRINAAADPQEIITMIHSLNDDG